MHFKLVVAMVAVTASPTPQLPTECRPVRDAFLLLLDRPFFRMRQYSSIGGDDPKQQRLYERAKPDRERIIDSDSGVEVVTIGDRGFLRKVGVSQWKQVGQPQRLPGLEQPFAEYTTTLRSCIPAGATDDGVGFTVTIEPLAGIKNEKRLWISADGLPTKITWDEPLTDTRSRHFRQELESPGGKIEVPVQ